MSQTFDCTSDEGRQAGIAAAVAAVRDHQVVVLPTDTVYGVGSDAFSPQAVRAVLDAKARGTDMPPPVLIPHARTADGLATAVPAYARDLMDAFWPGPLTLVLLAQPSLMWDLGDTNGTVALRVPRDDVALQVLSEVGPMAVTSANLTGRPAALTVREAQLMLGDAVSVYLDGGPCTDDEPSTILDCTQEQPRILRQGALSADEIAAVIAPVIIDGTSAPTGHAAIDPALSAHPLPVAPSAPLGAVATGATALGVGGPPPADLYDDHVPEPTVGIDQDYSQYADMPLDPPLDPSMDSWIDEPDEPLDLGPHDDPGLGGHPMPDAHGARTAPTPGGGHDMPDLHGGHPMPDVHGARTAPTPGGGHDMPDLHGGHPMPGPTHALDQTQRLGRVDLPPVSAPTERLALPRPIDPQPSTSSVPPSVHPAAPAAMTRAEQPLDRLSLGEAAPTMLIPVVGDAPGADAPGDRALDDHLSFGRLLADEEATAGPIGDDEPPSRVGRHRADGD